MNSKFRILLSIIYIILFTSQNLLLLPVKASPLDNLRKKDFLTTNDKLSTDNIVNDNFFEGQNISDFFESPNNYTQKNRIQYASDEIIVKYKSTNYNGNNIIINSFEKQQIIAKYNFAFKNSIVKNKIDVLKINDGKTISEAVEELSKDPNIEYAEPNYYYYPQTNDTFYSSQWYLENIGQTVNGTNGLVDADVDAPEAWDIFSRNPNDMIIAVIDSGVTYNHPDLINKMWDGSNCVDENGFYLGNCLYGYDFINNDKDPYPITGQTHGTHVAGIIAADSNNNRGISGVTGNAKIMALNISNSYYSYELDAAARAVYFALNNNVKIINMSFGGDFNSQTLYDAIQAFGNNGGLVIAAAGNFGDNTDTNPFYPASYNLPNIISVAASNQTDVLESFSNYGSTSVDLAAPGSNIISTVGWDNLFYEDFQDATVPFPPYAWTFTGYSATAENDLFGYSTISGVGDYFVYPYHANADSSMISPLVNFTGFNTATLNFETICDTEFTSNDWYDYMTVEISNNNGATFQEYFRYDEYEIANLGGIDFTLNNGATAYYYPFLNIPIPSNYLTSEFRVNFRWRTDSSVSDQLGCLVDNISISQDTTSANIVERYIYQAGTSMATPIVASAASLLWGYRPDLNYSEIKTALMQSGDAQDSLLGKSVSGRRLNIEKALQLIQGDVIESFAISIPPNTYKCSISEKFLVINCTLPSDVNKTNIAPVISITGGSILPSNGTPNNFITNPNYQFTKSDLTVENYYVNIHNTFSPNTLFRSGQYNWGVANTKYITSGDYDGDGQDEIAAMYDYGQEDMALIVFSGDGSSFDSSTWFRSGAYNWGVPYTKYLTSGDFDNDGKDEIAAMYDYGREDMALIVFDGNSNTFTPSVWFRSGAYNWGIAHTKYVTAGDFDNDGKDELSAMYDYGREDMALIVFDGNNSFSPTTWFRSGAYNWGIAYTKYVTAGDFNDDGKDELAAMYDYGREDMALIVFNGNNYFSPTTWFRSGAYNWGIAYTKYVTSGDFNNDGKDELTAMYDYGNQDMSLIVFNATNSTFSPESWFRSGAWNWSINNTKFVTPGDFNGNGITELGAIYDYTREDMSIIVFK